MNKFPLQLLCHCAFVAPHLLYYKYACLAGYLMNSISILKCKKIGERFPGFLCFLHFSSFVSHPHWAMESLQHCKPMVLCLWLAFSFGLCFVPVLGELQTFEHPTKGDGTLSFLVIGDWGRQGEYNQSEVAVQMGIVGEKLDIDFVVSTGDNFYDDGLTGELDPAFVDSFVNIYTAKSLQKQWYSILGNHDYRGDVEAQLSPFLRKLDSRWLCLRSFIVNAEIADLFFVDTTPFVKDYLHDPEDHTYDWKGVSPMGSYTSKVLEDLDSALKKSTAEWKIVVGHHAIRSVGHHGDTIELVERLLPILQANNVDLYMNGHDHCLEHISDDRSPIQFLTSGAGSKAWRGDLKELNREGLKFFYDGQGFMSVRLTQTDVETVFYDVFGSVLHKWTISKQLHSAV